LAACPAGSPIFTQELNNYAGISDGIAINTDGTVFTTSIKGRSYYGQPGYSTYPPNQSGVGREIFTYANSPEYYINAGYSVINGDTTHYYAFAIGWAKVQPTTFVLSNEEDSLIDYCIELGYGHMNLYMTLVALQEASGGVISDTFLDVTESPSIPMVRCSPQALKGGTITGNRVILPTPPTTWGSKCLPTPTALNIIFRYCVECRQYIGK